MERLPKDKILDYNPDTLTAVRKLYNLDKPGQMDEAIDLLDAWVKKQSHFVRKDYPREYLERVIILFKGSVERAKSQLDKICTLRTLLPEYFENNDVKNDLKELEGKWYTALLPELTNDHTRIYIVKTNHFPYTTKIFHQTLIYVFKICEYMKAHDYSDGVTIISDYREVHNLLDLVTAVDIIEFRRFISVFLQGYATRIKHIFILSSSKTINVFINILNQAFTAKLREKIRVVKTLDELHKVVPREVLPSDYGGDQKPLPVIHEEFLNVLSSPENIAYLKEMSQARTNESMRSTLAFNEEYLGMPGTFRTLNVD